MFTITVLLPACVFAEFVAGFERVDVGFVFVKRDELEHDDIKAPDEDDVHEEVDEHDIIICLLNQFERIKLASPTFWFWFSLFT